MKKLLVLFIVAACLPGCVKHIPSTPSQIAGTQAVKRGYPLLGSYALLPNLSLDQATAMATYYTMGIIGVENQTVIPNPLDKLRQVRPNFVAIPYLSLGTFPDGQMDQNEGPNGPVHQLYRRLTDAMKLYNTQRTWIGGWPGSHFMNLTTLPWPNLIVDVIPHRNFATHPIWVNGVFLDEVFRVISWLSPLIDADQDGHADNPTTLDAAWGQGEISVMSRLRQALPSTGIIISQNGMQMPDNFLSLLNGVVIEDAFGAATLLDQLIAKLQATASCRAPRYTILNVCGNQADKTLMRTGMALACLFDSYYFYDYYKHPTQAHDQVAVFLPDYRLDLGNPTAAPSTVSPKVWKRPFTKGLVAFNASAAIATVSFTGQLWDADGQTFTTGVTLASRHGVVLYNYHP